MDSDYVSLLTAVLIVVAAYGLSRATKFLLEWLMGRLFDQTKTQLDDLLVAAVRGPLATVIFVAGLEIALQQIDAIPVDWRAGINRIFFILYLLLAYVALYRLIVALAGWYRHEVAEQTETELDDKFLNLFRYMAIIIVTSIAIIILLGEFGIEPSALVTTLGIGSLAIALAAQATLGDMIAGFMIMIDQPFRVGDRIELLDIATWGDVKDIGLRSTRILTRDNRMVSIPNSVIGKGLVVNYSIPSTKYRVETHVGVAYGTDVEKVREVMIAAVRAEAWVMQEERIEALLLEFGDSALVFRVRCWIEHYVETRRVMDKMNTALYQALRREGIDIPFPQREVRLLSEVVPDSE